MEKHMLSLKCVKRETCLFKEVVVFTILVFSRLLSKTSNGHVFILGSHLASHKGQYNHLKFLLQRDNFTKFMSQI